MNFTTFLLANLYLGCWILLYYVAFSRKTSFRHNRVMLLGGIALSFLLPFVTLPSLDIFSSGSLTAPVITSAGGTAVVLSPVAYTLVFPIWNTLLWVYWLGVICTAIVFLWKLFRIVHYMRKFPHIRHQGYIHVQSPAHWEVFSFMNYMFAPTVTAKSIIEHEKAHIRQRHSLDNLFTEIIKIFCWFNPAIYYCQRALKMDHEYLADAATIKIVDVKEYAEKLVNRSFELSNLSLVHPFLNRSRLQKRLIMLQKGKKSQKKIWTYLLLLPALAGILLLSSSFSLKQKLNDTIKQIKPKILNEPLTVIGYPIQSVPASPKPKNLSVHTTQPANPNHVFMFVEQAPQFPGGNDKLSQYLSSHVRYPDIAKQKGIQGTVKVQFVVNTDGSISEVKVVSRKMGDGLEKEAIRVVKNMPKWIPGKQNGKIVRTRGSLPIHFKLQ